jgi:deazaflavin-dependent oxidoreductase (nitroreductase family)
MGISTGRGFPLPRPVAVRWGRARDRAADGWSKGILLAMDQRSETHSPALAPTRGVALIRRIAGPIWQMVGIAAVLTVADRRTGTPRRVPLIPIKVDGSWYVLSFGGVTEWSLDLRAAGRGELRRKGRTEAYTAIEVESDERERVIAAYLRGSGPVRKDFERRPNAADHPAFRLEPLPAP